MISRFTAAAAGILLAGALATAIVPQQASAQVQRADVSSYIGYDTFRSAALSPNGRYIAGILRDAEGDLLIIHDRTTKETKAIQRAREDQSLILSSIWFKNDERLIFSLQQKYEIVAGSGGTRTRAKPDEDGHFQFVSRVYASDLDGGNLISLYEPASEQGFPRWLSANVSNVLRNEPHHVLMRIPTSGGTELRKVDIRNGEYDVIERGGARTVGWSLDNNLNAVLREDSIAGGRGTAWLRKDASGSWVEIARFRGAERANGAPEFQGVGKGTRPGTAIVSARPHGRDTNGLYLYDATTGEYAETLFEHDLFDVFQVILDPLTDEVVGACYNGFKYTCVPSEEKLAGTWAALQQAVGEDNNLRLSAGGDLDKSFLVHVEGPKEPGSYYVFDAETRSLEFFQSQRQVNPDLMASQHVVDYVAADGTEMWGYLWLPPGATMETKNLPMITLPHGGPEARDVWGFDPLAGYWSAQGYAVFQPHFRGGSGTGRKWVEAGWGQWGQLIQSDINDGTRAMIARGIADPNRICVAGWSHGGYVAFTASYLDTDLYKCSMAGAGVSDLRRMQDWVRDEQGGRQSISYKYWANAIGDPNDDKGKLDAYSARRNAEQVGMPLLIMHGEIDTTVPVEQSLDMAKALDRAKKPYELVVIEDMDHYLRADQGDDWALVLTKSKDFFDQHIGPGWTPN